MGQRIERFYRRVHHLVVVPCRAPGRVKNLKKKLTQMSFFSFMITMSS
jgi:hypothetical protein